MTMTVVMAGTIAAFPGLLPVTRDAVAALQTPSLVLHFNSESFHFVFATFSHVSVYIQKHHQLTGSHRFGQRHVPVLTWRVSDGATWRTAVQEAASVSQCDEGLGDGTKRRRFDAEERGRRLNKPQRSVNSI